VYYNQQKPWKRTIPTVEHFLKNKKKLNTLKDDYMRTKNKSEQQIVAMYLQYLKVKRKLEDSERVLSQDADSGAHAIGYKKESHQTTVKNYLNLLFLRIFENQNTKLPEGLALKSLAFFPCFHTPEEMFRQDEKDDFMKYEEPFFDEEINFSLPNYEEDFEVSEGAVFKGHSNTIRSIIKLNLREFMTADDNGQVIIWNKKSTIMRGFTLRNIDSPQIEPIFVQCLTEKLHKYAIGGMKKGHLVMYNREKGGKRVIEYAAKKGSDIVAMCTLDRMKGKYFLIQDSTFNIYMYSAEELFYHENELERV